MIDPSRLFVCNFPLDTTAQFLKEWISSAGLVKHVLVCTEKDTERPKGYGFIQMESEEAAQQAILKFDGTKIGDRTVRVAVAKERPVKVE